jgi:hypothetical protein
MLGVHNWGVHKDKSRLHAQNTLSCRGEEENIAARGHHAIIVVKENFIASKSTIEKKVSQGGFCVFIIWDTKTSKLDMHIHE